MNTVRVQVNRPDGRPAEGACVQLCLVPVEGGTSFMGEPGWVDRDGMVQLEYDDAKVCVARLIVAALDHWTIYHTSPDSSVVIVLPPLPRNGPLGWWHEAVSLRRYSAARGEGIRIGVIDTGVTAHPALAKVKNCGTFEGMLHRPDEGADRYGHGTHVCGIIAAQPLSPDCFAGLASGAQVYSVRVTTQSRGADPEEERRTQDAIAEAVEYLSEDKGVHLINISLGSPVPSVGLRSRILEARNRGVLCFCAAGNDDNECPQFPASMEETIGVSAIGCRGVGPLPDCEFPDEDEKIAGASYYIARLSNYGPGITCCAPGVRIISTAPVDDDSYVPMNGTSMASPVACGSLAGLLAEDEEYLRMNRDWARAEYAREVLRRSCLDIGLATKYQGFGLIQARKVLS